MTFWRSAAVICCVGEIQTSSPGKPLSAGSCVLGTCDAIPLQERLFNCLNTKWHEGPWLQPQFWSCWPVASLCAAGAARVSCVIWKLKCRSTDQIRLLDKEEDALSFWSFGLVCFVFLLFLTSGCCCGKCTCFWWEVRVPGFPRTCLVGAGEGGLPRLGFCTRSLHPLPSQLDTVPVLPGRPSTTEPGPTNLMTSNTCLGSLSHAWLMHLTGVVLKLQPLPPLIYRPFSLPMRKKERQLLVTG